MARSTQPQGCARQIKTLAGYVTYKDSGWTRAEWALIETAMARCTGRYPDRHKPRKQPPAPKPRIPTAERRRLAQQELVGQQLQLKLDAAQRRETR
jgi:hypothetical protein